MGGFLGGVFKGTNADGSPLSTGQSILQGTLKNGIGAAGNALQQPGKSPGTSGASLPGAPAASPVDPRFFTPTATSPRTFLPGGASPGLVQPINPSSAFYG